MKRALIILIGALLLALFLLAGAVVFLALTDGGTRFLAGQAERFLPVQVQEVSGALLREVRVGRLVLELDARTVEIHDLAASVQVMPLLFDNQLVVNSVTATAVIVEAAGEPAPAGPAPPLQLPYMPVGLDVTRLQIDHLAVLEIFPMAVAASAAWSQDGVTVRSLEIDSDVLTASLQGSLGTGSNPSLSALAEWALAGPENPWSGQGRLQGRVDALEVQHSLRGAVSVDARGNASLAVIDAPVVDLQVDVGDLQFGEVEIAGIGGRLRGTMENLVADAAARINLPDIDPFSVTVQAYGPMMGPLTLRNVEADALAGVQQAQGTLAWQDDVQVRLGGSMEEVSLDGFRDELSGRVSGAFQFRYEREMLSLALWELSGHLNGRPVGGTLEVAQQSDGWAVDPLRVSVGENTLSGRLRLHGESVELQGDIAAPQLEALGLGVSGDVAGRVGLSGAWPHFDGSASLSATRLEGLDVALRDAVIDASLAGGRLEASLEAAGVERESLALENPRLTADGMLDDLNWRFAWAEGEGAGTLRWRDAGTEVGLHRAQVALLDQQWTLAEPTSISIGERIEVAPLCVGGGDASACLESFVYADGALTTQGALVRAPVALLEPFLPVRLGSEGFLEGNWSLAGEPGSLSGQVVLAARRLAFLPGAEEESIDLPDLELSGSVQDDVADLRLTATGEAFSVIGEGRLQGLHRDGALAGSIAIAASDLAPLTVFDRRIEELGGSIEGNLDIAGTLAAPRAEGRFELGEGRLKINDPDINLSAVTVQMQVDDSGVFEVRGTGRQRNNEVALSASGSGLFDGKLAVDASLKGAGLRAEHPDWEVTVSPDLTLSFADGRGRLRGRVEVPQAEVRLTTLPTTVPSPSDDVVVVGRDNGPGGTVNPIRVDVDVVLGDDVSLRAMGIVAELQGSLRARLDNQGRTTLRGTLDITGGVMSTQGQTLAIESGSVVYNGPVTRPYIDLRAVRNITDVTPPVKVGLHIRGDANNLTSSVFSEPAMADTRALSFLILGRDIEQETASTDGNQLMAAAINLGLSRSKGITSELMRMTGLDELSATAETEDSFAIVAGKRVSDDLYVRYTYNTLSAVGAFLVRYDLGRRWQLEARSGEESAMDLMYSFDK